MYCNRSINFIYIERKLPFSIVVLFFLLKGTHGQEPLWWNKLKIIQKSTISTKLAKILKSQKVFFYLDSLILFHYKHLIVTSFLAVDIWKLFFQVKLLQILVYFCFFLHMFEKNLFFKERSSKFFSIWNQSFLLVY